MFNIQCPILYILLIIIFSLHIVGKHLYKNMATLGTWQTQQQLKKRIHTILEAEQLFHLIFVGSSILKSYLYFA